MFDLKLRAWFNNNMYDVVNIDLLGAIKKVKLLDIYSEDTQDGNFEIIDVQLFDSIIKIMRSSDFQDKNLQDIYEGDIVKTNYGTFSVYYNKKTSSFQLGEYSKSDLFDLNHNTVKTFKIEVIGNIYKNKF